MKKLYRLLTNINTVLEKAETFVGSACLGVLFVVMIVNATLRYLFRSGLNWSDELNGFLFVWFGLLAAAYSMSRNNHLNITAVINLFPAGLKYALATVMNCIMIVMFVIYMPALGKLLNTLPKSNVMRVPLKYVYYILPLCFGLMTWHCVFNIIRDSVRFFTGGKEEQV